MIYHAEYIVESISTTTNKVCIFIDFQIRQNEAWVFTNFTTLCACIRELLKAQYATMKFSIFALYPNINVPTLEPPISVKLLYLSVSDKDMVLI